MIEEELARLLRARLPARDFHDLQVDDAADQDVRLWFPFAPDFAGPGGIFSGPALLGMADTAMFAAAQARLGAAKVAPVSTTTTTFLRPAQLEDVVALARVVRAGRTLLHVEAWLFNHMPVDAILHATATCVVRDWSESSSVG